MSDLTKSQQCPHCNHVVDDSHAEWEEGTHDVTCESCDKEYMVSPQYKFLGFAVVCGECHEIKSECYCDDENDEITEDEGEQIDLLDLIG